MGMAIASKKENLYILGRGISHSKSPAMYNALYEKLGLPWEYDFADIPTVEEAESFLRARDFLSINITTPYKPEAYEAADFKAATAQLAKGVNLLVNKDGTLVGYNVDGQGCVAYLEREGVVFKDEHVVICGTGPTSLSILHACAQAGACEVLLLGRDKDRAARVISRYLDDYHHLASTAIDLPSATDGHLSFVQAYEKADFKYGSYATSKQAIAAADIIIDATSLGMNPGDPAPFDTSLLNSSQVVMDTVYGHGTTAMVASARRAGCRTFDGAGMLVAQAVISATIVCEIAGIDLKLSFDDMFDLMWKAAEF